MSPSLKYDPDAIVTGLPEFLDQRRLTIERLSSQMGVPHETLRSVYHGTRRPTIVLALRLAAYFDVPVNALFELRSRIVKEAAARGKQGPSA
jgi:plasmid maintenance system antidote protein VapI